MRIWIAIVAVVGCKQSVDNQQARDLPRPTAFAAMSTADQCTATAPRARPCHNELLNAELGSLDVPYTVKDSPVDDREAEALQGTTCLGNPSYARAIYQCWDQPSCAQLAKCTVEREKLLDGSAAPRVDSGSGSDVPHHKVELVP